MPFGSFLAALGQGAFGVGTAMNQYQKQVSDDDAAEAQAKQAATANRFKMQNEGWNPLAQGAAAAPNDYNDGNGQNYRRNFDDTKEGMIAQRNEALATQKETAATKAKDQINQMAYGALQRSFKDHPLSAAPYNPGVDYRDELKSAENPGKYSSAGITAEKGLAQYTASLKPDKNDPTEIKQVNMPDGTTKFYRISKTGGDAEEVQGVVGAQKGAAGAAGGIAQTRSALMMSAMTEARLADERMRKFEDGLLSSKQSIGPLAQAGGTLMTNLTGTHSLLGSLGQAGAEAGLNAKDPSYVQYLRDASTIGRAESMVMPRGGNETMVRANSVLARAGSGASHETIDAARMARQALFGTSGGIAQTMSPAQTQKLEAGVRSIKAGEHGSSSTPASPIPQLLSGGPSAPASRPPLSARVTQLKSMGLSKSAAMAQLQHEGYDLHNEE
jgi:hypothetical protein